MEVSPPHGATCQCHGGVIELWLNCGGIVVKASSRGGAVEVACKRHVMEVSMKCYEVVVEGPVCTQYTRGCTVSAGR